MNQTHFSVDGEHIPLPIGTSISIFPGNIQQSRYEDVGNQGQSDSFQESEVLSTESIVYECKQFIPHQQISQNSDNNINQEKIDKRLISILQDRSLETIIAEKNKNTQTYLKLTNDLLIQKIQSDMENNQEQSKKSPKKKKTGRSRRFQCQELEQDKMKDLQRKNNQLLEQIKQKDQMLGMIIKKTEKTQKMDVMNMSPKQGQLEENQIKQQNMRIQIRERPNKSPQIRRIVTQDQNILSFPEQNASIINSKHSGSSSVTTQVKYNQSQTQRVQEKYDQNYISEKSTLRVPANKISFDIPEYQIDDTYPQGKSTQQLYKIALNLYKKLAGMQINPKTKIKITSHPNCLVIKFSEDKTIVWKKDGSFYLGGWLNNLKHGMGLDIKPMKYKYKGYFLNGKKHGQGCIKTIKGIKYFGNWQNGEKCGYGKQTDADGNIYKGNWKNDQYDGQGIQILSSGDVFEGQFKYGMKNGWIYWHKNNNEDCFQGNYVNDLRDGYGQYYWDSGKVFRGEFLNGFKVQNATIQQQTPRPIKSSRNKSFIVRRKVSKQKACAFKADKKPRFQSLDTSKKILETIYGSKKSYPIVTPTNSNSNLQIKSKKTRIDSPTLIHQQKQTELQRQRQKNQKIRYNSISISKNLCKKLNSSCRPIRPMKRTNSIDLNNDQITPNKQQGKI